MGHNSKCFVPNCNTGYNSCKKRYSLFSAPKDEKLRRLWNKAICREDRILTEKDVVCAKHFLETDILKEWTSGHVIIPYKKPRLKNSAVPSIFSYKQLLSENVKPEKKKRQKIKQDKTISEKALPFNSDVSNTINSEPVFIDVFKQLWLNRDVLKMPNTEWTLHYIDKYENKKILITECSVTNDEVPFFLRNIIINQDSQLKSFLGSVEITDNTLNSLSLKLTQFTNISEIQSYLNNFSKTTICGGGPSTKIHSINEITIREAKIDVNGVWRHNSCTLILNGSDGRCTWCTRVYDYFINHLLSIKS